jgi:hypothetical protein
MWGLSVLQSLRPRKLGLIVGFLRRIRVRRHFKGVVRVVGTQVEENSHGMNLWMVAPAGGIMGQLMQNQLPSFWSDSLSRIFGDASVSIVGGNEERSFQGIVHGAAELRPRKRTPAGVKREKARQMRASGYSYGEIASALG